MRAAHGACWSGALRLAAKVDLRLVPAFAMWCPIGMSRCAAVHGHAAVECSAVNSVPRVHGCTHITVRFLHPHTHPPTPSPPPKPPPPHTHTQDALVEVGRDLQAPLPTAFAQRAFPGACSHVRRVWGRDRVETSLPPHTHAHTKSPLQPCGCASLVAGARLPKALSVFFEFLGDDGQLPEDGDAGVPFVWLRACVCAVRCAPCAVRRAPCAVRRALCAVCCALSAER
jgi:hypothetical protein